MKAQWPERTLSGADASSEAQMETVMATITGVRNVRGEMNISPSTRLSLAVKPEDAGVGEVIDGNRDLILNLARLTDITVDAKMSRPKVAATVLIDGATLYVLLEGILDFEQEIDVKVVKEWVADKGQPVLNVAGPRESKSPGIYREAEAFLKRLFKNRAKPRPCTGIPNAKTSHH